MRRTCVGEIEASKFDVKKVDRESVSHAGFGFFMQPGEILV